MAYIGGGFCILCLVEVRLVLGQKHKKKLNAMEANHIRRMLSGTRRENTGNEEVLNERGLTAKVDAEEVYWVVYRGMHASILKQKNGLDLTWT